MTRPLTLALLLLALAAPAAVRAQPGATRGPENPTVPGGGEPGTDAERLRGARPDATAPMGGTRSGFPPAGSIPPDAAVPSPAAPGPAPATRGYEGAPSRDGTEQREAR